MFKPVKDTEVSSEVLSLLSDAGTVFLQVVGPQGAPGQDGERGTKWYYGGQAVAATPIPGDYWLDDNGYVYEFIDGEWIHITNIRGPQGMTGIRGAVWFANNDQALGYSPAPGDMQLQTDGTVSMFTTSGVWYPKFSIRGPRGPAGAIMFIPVPALPDKNDPVINPNAVYLVKVADSGNKYAEYIYIDGDWEPFGTFEFAGDLPVAIANLQDGDGEGSLQQIPDGVADGFAFAEYNEDGSVKEYKNPNAIQFSDPVLKAYLDSGGLVDYGANGNYSSTFGGKSCAYGKRSLAEGTTTIAMGDYSHVEGNNSVTYGANSHAEGKRTTTVGENAHAEGFDALAEGYISHAEGYKTTAKGACSHSEGIGTTAEGDQSHAEGNGTFSIGACSHAEGEGSKAHEYASHAEGKDAEAKGYASHAEGISTIALGLYSHAEGGWTYANGQYSHAGGTDSIADYYCDFVHGEGLRTTYEHQTVFGRFNDDSNWSNNRPLFMIGNGTSNTDRSNAFEVLQDGTAKLSDKFVATEDYVTNLPDKTILSDGQKVKWREMIGAKVELWEFTDENDVIIGKGVCVAYTNATLNGDWTVTAPFSALPHIAANFKYNGSQKTGIEVTQDNSNTVKLYLLGVPTNVEITGDMTLTFNNETVPIALYEWLKANKKT